jgi:hypothetical protein
VHVAIGPFEVRCHHCLELWVSFVVPVCAPVARLAGIGWVIPSATVAAPWRPHPLITLSPVLLSPVLCAPIVLISPARRALCLPVGAAPRSS